MRTKKNSDTLTIFLEGELDAQNAGATQEEIMDVIGDNNSLFVVFDAEKLEYISSAGLRVLLSTQKSLKSKIAVINLRKEVLETFKMAGFEHIMDIKSA